MATLQNSYPCEGFRVVHPLSDAPERKCASEGIGPIAMTSGVRISLIVLRGYLVLMTAMLAWRVLELAGLLYGGR